jgi:hypothetical protein
MATDDMTASCEGENFTLNYPTREYVTGLTSLADIGPFFPYCEKALKENKYVIGLHKTQNALEHNNKSKVTPKQAYVALRGPGG